ncbi:TPA: hypothetical protein N0F65_006822 [Lagenidium giganteum]|uniref:Protein kinase domain-containing protein n=1 Tax=Lagenidium giganteum TaxID=4803 RepID=A0AAV2Z8A2_9STRA|nr:TPA: hypothetical protein N0F65_006822 [Lagenidium giganteum]
MTAIKCATSKVTTTSTGSFWAEGSIQTELEPRVYKHDGGSWTIYAIHATKDTTSSGCDATTSVVVPCVLEDGGGWCDPTPSSAFSVNLKLFASGGPKGGTSTSGSNGSGSKKSSTTYIIVGVVVAVVIAIVAGLVYRRRRARRASTENSVHESEVQLHRLDYAKLHIGDTIAKGGFGEVCLGSYEGRRVAVKRLVRHKRREVAEVESFAEEIQLMCKLKHPNINTFYGVAWNNIHDLCIATEFATHGDLRSFLQKRTPMELPWHREKIRFVLDIGEALIYLHSLQPKVIHRDIKSKNMLISEDMRAKLIDFGASRERILDETMTAGVGTVRWTAPEVLSGSPYSEKADIYAFGVVLVEIDTHLLPYDRQVNQAGNRIGDMEIAAGVITANLRPEFSSSCPSAIKQLGEWCMLKDQDRRPTAMELVYHIQQRVIPLLPTQASRVPDWD